MSVHLRILLLAAAIIIGLELYTKKPRTSHQRRVLSTASVIFSKRNRTNSTNDSKADLDLSPEGLEDTFGITYTLNDGNKIPVMALGTRFEPYAIVNGTRIRSDENVMTKAVETALKYGFGHIETAASYKTEKMVGLGVRNFLNYTFADRDEVFITTQLPNDAHERHQVIPSLKESLARLKMDYVDLYLVEYPMAITKSGYFNTTDYLETWKGMENAKEQNLTKSIGVSNFNITQMNRLWNNSRIKPAVLQIDINPTLTQEELVDWCQEHGVVVMASNPFGVILSGKLPLLPLNQHKQTMLEILANKYRKLIPQILLRYLLDRKLIPVPRLTQPLCIDAVSDIFDFRLAPEEIKEVSSLNMDLRIRPLFKWYPHPHFPFEKYNFTEKQINEILEYVRDENFDSL